MAAIFSVLHHSALIGIVAYDLVGIGDLVQLDFLVSVLGNVSVD